MQVVCGNCQLSFQAPDGAAGLVCPICRSPLRAPDAGNEAEAPTTRQIVDWSGGTLDDLVALLSGPAWSARVEVLPSDGGAAFGEVHVIAGGVSDAIHDGKSTHDALDQLRAIKNTRFRIEPRLPNPSDGDLTFPGPDQGKLEERPLATLMRYCEDYVLTAAIEVWRGSEDAKVDYRRGEIVGVIVGGIDAPERLAEVMKWSSGSYRLIAPKLTLPETAPKAAVPATVVASRSSGAASKTIFGMPALDPATIAAATEKGKPASAPGQTPALPQAAAATAPAAGRPSATSIPAVAAPAAPRTTGATTPPAAAATTTTPATTTPATTTAPPAAARLSTNKTIFGVQAPPPAAATPAAASTAAPPAAVTPVAAPPAATPVASRPSSPSNPVASPRAGTTPPPAAAPSTPKPSRPSSPATPAPASAVAPAPAAAPARTHAPAAAHAPMSAATDDRTQPTKTGKQPPRETPVWTYVVVGFFFGLALLGVYRLVILLAH